MFLIANTFCFVKAAVLDQGLEGLEADLVAEVQSYLEDLIASGLRQRIISLIKVLTFFLKNLVSIKSFLPVYSCSFW